MPHADMDARSGTRGPQSRRAQSRRYVRRRQALPPSVEWMVKGDSPDGERDDGHFKAQPSIREILASLELSSCGLRWIASYSHSAWMTDEVVVRYRTFGPTGRLSH